MASDSPECAECAECCLDCIESRRATETRRQSACKQRLQESVHPVYCYAMSSSVLRMCNIHLHPLLHGISTILLIALPCLDTNTNTNSTDIISHNAGRQPAADARRGPLLQAAVCVDPSPFACAGLMLTITPADVLGRAGEGRPPRLTTLCMAHPPIAQPWRRCSSPRSSLSAYTAWAPR